MGVTTIWGRTPSLPQTENGWRKMWLACQGHAPLAPDRQSRHLPLAAWTSHHAVLLPGCLATSDQPWRQVHFQTARTFLAVKLDAVTNKMQTAVVVCCVSFTVGTRPPSPWEPTPLPSALPGLVKARRSS